MFPRTIYKNLKGHLAKKEITVLTGMRRTGKTTLAKQLFSEIESQNKIYIDLQVLANQDIFSPRNFDAIIEILKQKGLDFSRKVFIVLDEIQLVKEIPGILKYLHDNYDIKFIVTGSSSYYLKNLFTESLAGRKKIFELFPLDFGEYLIFKGIEAPGAANWFEKPIQLAEYSWLGVHYGQFVEFGGFPQAVLAKTEAEKREILNEIISSYVNLDVSSLADFAERQEAFTLVKMLAARAGGKLDYSKLSRLAGIPRARVKNYVELFESAYLISKIPIFTKNADREIVKAEKIYFCDSGLLGILADVGSGAKFENAVYAQLRQRGGVKYYSLKTGREIDFIFDEKYAFEAKETPMEIDKNDLAGLADMAGIKKYKLIGKSFSKSFGEYVWGGSIR